VFSVEKVIICERVLQGLSEPAWGPYRNAHFSVPKKNGKYNFIISAVCPNWHTLADARILPNLEVICEGFTGMPWSSLIDFDSGYDEKMLHQDNWDYTAFRTTQGMYWPTTLVRGRIDSLSASVGVSRKILNANLASSTELCVDNVGVKRPKSQYGDREVEGFPGG
jgi:hypothetical protein